MSGSLNRKRAPGPKGAGPPYVGNRVICERGVPGGSRRSREITG